MYILQLLSHHVQCSQPNLMAEYSAMLQSTIRVQEVALFPTQMQDKFSFASNSTIPYVFYILASTFHHLQLFTCLLTRTLEEMVEGANRGPLSAQCLQRSLFFLPP